MQKSAHFVAVIPEDTILLEDTPFLTALHPNDDRAAPEIHCSALRYLCAGPLLRYTALIAIRFIIATSPQKTHAHSLMALTVLPLKQKIENISVR